MADGSLRLHHLTVKQFRCFDNFTIDLDGRHLLIEGVNGTGKTTLLEALHYACYLRSFRTHTPRDLVQLEQDGFFVKLKIATHQHDHDFNHDIQIGFTGGKRQVKVDQKNISSYKELMDHYRVVSLTEDDVGLIKEGPQVRRSFLDQALLLHNPDYAMQLRTLRQLVDNRNAFLQRRSVDSKMYEILSQQLWELTHTIQAARADLLGRFVLAIDDLLEKHLDGALRVACTYMPKQTQLDHTSFADILAKKPGLQADEQRFGRSLFGAHLDDFGITVQGRKSKWYASRGQQKLVVLLLKVAHINELAAKRGQALFLLDDFMTDFDEIRSTALLEMLCSMGNQLIFTSPLTGSTAGAFLRHKGAQMLSLTY